MEIILGLLLLGVIVGGAIIYTQGQLAGAANNSKMPRPRPVGSPSGWAARCWG